MKFGPVKNVVLNLKHYSKKLPYSDSACSRSGRDVSHYFLKFWRILFGRFQRKVCFYWLINQGLSFCKLLANVRELSFMLEQQVKN